MAQLLKATRYVILLPILGLALAAGLCFVLGGLGLIRLVGRVLLEAVGLAHAEPGEQGLVLVEIVEFVHTFLVGTVLYITAIGLYQLFIREIDFVGWLKVESTDELETNLVGVTVVVLAVNFMGAIFTEGASNLLAYGAAIALPIAALGLFIGLRAWAARLPRATPPDREHSTRQHDA